MEIDFLRSFSKDVEDVAPLQSTALYRAVYQEDEMTNFLHEKTQVKTTHQVLFEDIREIVS